MGSFSLRISSEGDDRLKLIWTLPDEGDTWEPPSYSIDAGLLLQAANAVRKQLKVIAHATGPFGAAEFAPLLQNLAQRGEELFLQLMPDMGNGGASDLQQRLEQVAQSAKPDRHDFKIILETEKLFVPWGFVFSGRRNDLPRTPTLSLADMKGFWLFHFNISIAHSSTSRLPLKRKSVACKLFALHADMFNGARELLKIDDEKCWDRLEKLLAGKMAPTMDWESFEAAWKEVRDDYDSVLYLFGHSDGQRIQLRDKDGGDEEDDPKFDLLAASLKRFRKRPSDSVSIFLLNGCCTAAPHPDSEEVPISANFLKETRQPGYFGFVGTEAQVSNVFACRYGTEFLWRLCREGRSVGETFDELLQDGKLFPQNLLYSCYADRKFRFASTMRDDNQP